MEEVNVHHLEINTDNARMLEKENHLQQAVKMYELLLKSAPSDMYIIERLMILYRKLKNFKKELLCIDKAIQIYEAKYTAGHQHNANVTGLSKKLNLMLGHTDRKGNSLLILPEVAKLKKRRDTALKGMK
ncbi:hypothetical protein QWZ08_11090 [Ferruginibacter paludis]|uniref:hypothetical protein n=1 Tax=Ferruginibacter paludis TaxID=1310417 RepID=UPI0025B58E3C|nr:hypothetical protein [Ferruginibacter paludis]MDN3656175.1 hypothetical protein [Ferruginibacter paludis]